MSALAGDETSKRISKEWDQEWNQDDEWHYGLAIVWRNSARLSVDRPSNVLSKWTLALGESFARPSENADPQIDAALGIIGTGSTMPNEPAASAENAAVNAVPWEARLFMNEPMVKHKLSRNVPASAEVPKAWILDLRSLGSGMNWAMDLADRLVKAQIGLADTLYRRERDEAERRFLTKGNWHAEWKSPHYAKENATNQIVNVYEWLCLPLSKALNLFSNGWLDLSRSPCHQLTENENAEPIAFVVFRRSKPDAVRKWTGAGSGASSSSRMKLSNYLNRPSTDHISIHDWDGTGDHLWRCMVNEPSLSSMGIARVPLSDPLCRTNPKPNGQIHEIVEWGMFATTTGRTLVEWRLMGHTMVPLYQAIGGGLEHDGSTGDEIYEDEENAANAWNSGMIQPRRRARMIAPPPMC
ncbi:unnamed protein product [Symbiodinium sp. KB8]|nr:unnamed protein product [Symbiodinium sp. KB8]